MKLKYKILWFEDDPDVINDEIGPELSKFLGDKGFELIIIHQENGDALDALIQGKDYDLILTDLNLGDTHEAGDKLIDHIRNDKILTEVLLYSANPDGVNRIINKPPHVIERVSFAVGMAALPDKIKRVINITIKKVEDVNNIRGLVIAETIDLEKKMEGILKTFFGVIKGTEVAKKKAQILQKIYDKKVEQHTTLLDKIRSLNFADLHEMMEQDILTANNTYDAIQSILNTIAKEINTAGGSLKKGDPKKAEYEAKKALIDKLKSDLKDFKEEIIKVRNTLSHVEEEIREDGTSYLKSLNDKDGTTIIFDEAKYAEIRRNLIKHASSIDKAGKIIKEAG